MYGISIYVYCTRYFAKGCIWGGGGSFLRALKPDEINCSNTREKLLLFPIRFFPLKIKLTSLIRDLAIVRFSILPVSTPPPSLFPGFDVNPFQFESFHGDGCSNGEKPKFDVVCLRSIWADAFGSCLVF